MIRRTQPTDPWIPLDFLLLEANQIIIDEQCGSCGYPRWACQHDDNDLRVQIVSETCYPTRERELHEKRLTEGDKKKPEGLQLRPRLYTASGAPLSSFRKPYYEAQEKKREAMMGNL